MKLFDIRLTPFDIKSWNAGRAVIAAALFSIASVSWAGDKGHNERHRDNSHQQHREYQPRQHQQRDRHRDNRQAEHHNKHRHHDKHRHQDKHRHHQQAKRQDTHSRHQHDHRYYSVPKRHHKHHNHNSHHAKYYRHDPHYRGHEAVFLLGGLILGAALSDVSAGYNDYYYDGSATRSYRNLKAQTCYRSYYDNGRHVLVETSRGFCQAY